MLRGEFDGLVLACDFCGAAAGAEALFEFVELLDEKAHVGGAGEGGGRRGVLGGHGDYCFMTADWRRYRGPD